MVRSTKARFGLTALAVAAAVFSPARARAQHNPAAAQALFSEARDLVDKGNFAEGCPKFSASFALNPSPSTLINVARCSQHDGRIATAWGDYNRALVLNRETVGAERKKALDDLAKAGIAELGPRLPKLRLVVDPKPAGIKVVRDETELPAVTLGDALPADPGPHRITVSAPGYKTSGQSIVLAEGKTLEVKIQLEVDPQAGAAPVAAGPAAPLTDLPPAKPTGVPTWAWVAGGAGVALIGGGIFFLADDLSAINALRKNCKTEGAVTTCAPGYDYASDNSRKNRGFALFLGLSGAGAIAVGASVYGISSAGSSRPKQAGKARITPWFGPGGAGASITGEL